MAGINSKKKLTKCKHVEEMKILRCQLDKLEDYKDNEAMRLTFWLRYEQLLYLKTLLWDARIILLEMT